MEKDVYVYLLKLGFSPKHSGFRFILSAIDIAVNQRINDFGKQIYAVLANKFDKNVFAVQQNIRNAISGAWLRADVEVLWDEFGYSVSKDGGVPSNREFIMLAADKLKNSVIA